MLPSLDPTKTIPVLHSWIRFLDYMEQVVYHTNAMLSFPNGIPFWVRGKKKGPVATKAVKDAAEAVRQKAKQPPLKLLLDAPDPHGNGGDNANTGQTLEDL
jgi:ribosomal protein S7